MSFQDYILQILLFIADRTFRNIKQKRNNKHKIKIKNKLSNCSQKEHIMNLKKLYFDIIDLSIL